MGDKITFTCPEQGCGFSTESEAKFASHLQKSKGKSRSGCLPVFKRSSIGTASISSGRELVIGAYTFEMRESKNTPVPTNPPTAEQETAVRDHDGNIIDGKTGQEVKDKLSKIRAFELECLMDENKLDRLERNVLRRDAQQAVEKKLDLHPTYPDDEEDEDDEKDEADEEDEEDEDEEVDEDGEEIIQFLTLRLRGCEHDRENHLD